MFAFVEVRSPAMLALGIPLLFFRHAWHDFRHDGRARWRLDAFV
ncbi:hypothetical protein C7S15_7907 [Burkholderia cepacia]|nr:hypothetical protein [Burkholderia cepacia]